MTVFDNVVYGLRLKRAPAEVVRARVRAALELVAIGAVDDVAYLLASGAALVYIRRLTR